MDPPALPPPSSPSRSMAKVRNFAGFVFNNPPPSIRDLDAYLDHVRLAVLYLLGLVGLLLLPTETSVFNDSLQQVQEWLDPLPTSTLAEFAHWLPIGAAARLESSLAPPAPAVAAPSQAVVVYQPRVLPAENALESMENDVVEADAEGEDKVTVTGERIASPDIAMPDIVVKTEPGLPPSPSPDSPTAGDESDELISFASSRTPSPAPGKPFKFRSTRAVCARLAFCKDKPGRDVRYPVVGQAGALGKRQAASCWRCAEKFGTKFACYAMASSPVYDPSVPATHLACYKCVQDRSTCDFRAALPGPFYPNPHPNAPVAGAPPAPKKPSRKRREAPVPESVSTRVVHVSSAGPSKAADTSARPSKRRRASTLLTITVKPRPSSSLPSSSLASTAEQLTMRGAVDTLERELADWRASTDHFERASEETLRLLRSLVPSDPADSAPESKSKGKGKRKAD
ncbi:hypothetical protein BJ138DRAFT_1120965 [Hygrophoropsis aurantiaca]|uniref:Uncharacterized protein n=1 Tax=Hygrophoropsis aurantiaca TaxID=72124 RepID=A0ACB7ZP93_9AGAM|nr:hypothetical protein BJ138DRAFT_1120965 [Hygrophoropsis aurantiaca]